MTPSQPAPSERILIVDDDAGIRDVISEYLGQQGYAVEAVADGQQMAQALSRRAADLVVLDLLLPGEDGLSLCRKLAQPAGPAIIMLTAVGGEVDRIVGLELGADHYIAKPCNPRELLARVRSVLRRRSEARSDASERSALEFSGWRLDLVQHELRSPDGALVSLPPGQYTLLSAFVGHPQRVLTRDQLLEYVGGVDTESFDRAIDVQISRLRRQLAASGGDTELIRTIRGEGYIFVPRVSRTQ